MEEEARVEEKGEGDREGEREKGGRRQLRSLLFFLALSLSLSLFPRPEVKDYTTH